ncbi:hypothetical protein I7I51_02628 [Histoplasma capsulatum]|uniref:Uncharacterized protein n=1 Tax=Ajellomyces capsulatus TaxID=5037 RepID=A0A8A1MAR3_AJECA|nr:hypothetical protein I7I51_02628 [Histoplasma capsulatum]
MKGSAPEWSCDRLILHTVGPKTATVFWAFSFGPDIEVMLREEKLRGWKIQRVSQFYAIEHVSLFRYQFSACSE